MKIPATIVCNAPGCDYQAQVDDLGAHMEDICPECGERIMDESSKEAFKAFHTLAEIGAVIPVGPGEGDMTLDSSGNWAEQLQSAFGKSGAH